MVKILEYPSDSVYGCCVREEPTGVNKARLTPTTHHVVISMSLSRVQKTDREHRRRILYLLCAVLYL